MCALRHPFLDFLTPPPQVHPTGLGLSTYTPPFFHFPGSLVFLEDAGRPSPATLQTQLTEGRSRATPQGPNSPFECV
ncbi:unnamed protein product [Tetraodon nigroviridis]|uniref:(spotted green pufferfish) hypothetical protein n=1 Tax=Tetraodon nigroviridis TaxID=99883 RepID=Q4SBG0_TETNG|nr:unnamed protein product [Tetraodon nigroviridis]